MPNFKINRKTENSDDYGCTDFETNQLQGETASLIDGDPLDGSIIWYLDANAGYTVSVDDFEIPGTTPTSAAQSPGSYRTFEGSGIPSPVLGVVFEQVTVTRIKITLFLHPSALHEITGSVFTMPSNSVAVNIPIEGCAELVGHGVNLRILSSENDNRDEITVTSTISEEVEKTLSNGDTSGRDIVISGYVPRNGINKELLSYTLTAKEGKRFLSSPTLNLSTDEYYTKSTTTSDDSGNIISTTFNIFKRT